MKKIILSLFILLIFSATACENSDIAETEVILDEKIEIESTATPLGPPPEMLENANFTTTPEFSEELPPETELEFVPPAPVAKDVFVKVSDYIPNIVTDLKYATEDNFTGQVIYDFEEAYLRYGTVEKLIGVQSDLNELGVSVKIWDAFRPVSAQWRLWEVYPDATFVANPNTGGSLHSCGNAIDLTLVWLENGEELEMPTGFDDFSALADKNYSDNSSLAGENSKLLDKVMTDNGFIGYYNEWWHYNDSDWYATETVFSP